MPAVCTTVTLFLEKSPLYHSLWRLEVIELIILIIITNFLLHTVHQSAFGYIFNTQYIIVVQTLIRKRQYSCPVNALTLLVRCLERYPACKNPFSAIAKFFLWRPNLE